MAGDCTDGGGTALTAARSGAQAPTLRGAHVAVVPTVTAVQDAGRADPG